jgi:hypothetical protein
VPSGQAAKSAVRHRWAGLLSVQEEISGRADFSGFVADEGAVFDGGCEDAGRSGIHADHPARGANQFGCAGGDNGRQGEQNVERGPASNVSSTVNMSVLYAAENPTHFPQVMNTIFKNIMLDCVASTC